MNEGMVSRNAPTLLKLPFIDDRKPFLSSKSVFGQEMGLNGSTASPEQAPILSAKSLTKKNINKCMAEI